MFPSRQQHEAPLPAGTAGPWRPVLGAAAIALSAVLGARVCGPQPFVALVPLAAAIAALVAAGPAEAAAVAASGSVLGGLGGRLAAGTPLLAGLGPLALVAVVAAAVAAGARWFLAGSPRSRPVLAAAAVAFVIAGMWMTVVTSAAQPAPDGTSFVKMLASPPAPTPNTSDEGLFLAIVARMHGGDGYYPASAQTLAAANTATDGFDLRSPTSFRPPAFYWLLALLPLNGIALVLVALGIGSVACVGAYAMARSFVEPAYALAAVAAVAGWYAARALTGSVLATEPLAGALGLVTLALLAAWRRSPRRTALGVAAAAVAFLAVFVRELAAPFLLLGLAVALTPRLRPSRAWLAFAAGGVAAPLLYLAHAAAARAAIRGLALPPKAHMNWFDPRGLGLLALAQRLAEAFVSKPALGWLALAAAAAGALAMLRRDRALGVALAVCALGGPAALTFLHPQGTASTVVPVYWADVIVPVLLVCVALALGALDPVRETGAEAAPVEDAVVDAGAA